MKILVLDLFFARLTMLATISIALKDISGDRSSVCSDHVLGPCVYVVYFCTRKKLCVNMCAFVRMCVFCMWDLQVLVLSSSICSCVHPYMCVCVCARASVCVRAHMYMYVCVCAFACWFMCLGVRARACACACVCFSVCLSV